MSEPPSRLPRAAAGSARAGEAGCAHRLATPRRARVAADPSDGRPLVVADRVVEAVRESWLVEDRWWNGAPVRRRYWEVVTSDGRDLVLFHDLRKGGWFVQR